MPPDPFAGVAQRLRLQLGDPAGGVGSHVEEQVTALGHDLGQQRHDLERRHVVFGALGPVVTEARSDASAQLPGALDDVGRSLVLVGPHE